MFLFQVIDTILGRKLPSEAILKLNLIGALCSAKFCLHYSHQAKVILGKSDISINAALVVLCCPLMVVIMHLFIILTAFPGGAVATPSCHRARSRVQIRQVTSQSQG